MVVGFGGLIYHFINLLMIFLRFEVQTEMIYNDVKFTMPSVVVCPETPYVKIFKIDRLVIFNLTLSGVFELLHRFWSLHNGTDDSYLRSRLSFAPYAHENKLFTEADDMSLFCRYANNQKCNVTNFMIADLSLCMRIDLPDSTEQNLWYGFFSKASYPANKSFYDLNDLYITKTSILSYQPKDEYPNLQSDQIKVFNKFMTTVYLDIRYQQELQVRDSCLSDPKPILILSFDDKYQEFLYTRNLCLLVKKQNFIYENCKCASEKLPIPKWNDSVQIKDIKFCHKISGNFIEFLKSNPSDEKILNSEEALLIKKNVICHEHYFSSWTADENCKNPCNSLRYSWSSINIDSWPSVMFNNLGNKDFLTDVNEAINNKMRKYNVSADDLHYSSLKINNKLKTNDITSLKILPQKPFGLKIIERESYPLINFLSSIGSIVVLWVGISLINVMEVIEMICKILHAVYFRYMNGK